MKHIKKFILEASLDAIFLTCLGTFILLAVILKEYFK